MGRFVLDSFYTYFQGAIILQSLLFLGIYLLYKKKEFLFYTLYLFSLAVYYQVNASDVLMGIPLQDYRIHFLLKYVNMPIVMLFNIFYLLFITSFLGLRKYRHIYSIIRILIGLILTSLAVFMVLIFLNKPVTIILNVINLTGLAGGLLLVVMIVRQKIQYSKYITAGMLLYIAGSIGSVIAVILAKKMPGLLFAEHTLFFVKLGVLADMFLYFIALIGKWIDTEKRIALLSLEKELALERERSRIKRDLHDELGASLSGIHMYSYLGTEQLKKNKTAEAHGSLGIIQQSASDMVDKLNDIVWLINAPQDSLRKLIERLEEYANSMAAVKNMQVKIKVPDKITSIALSIECRRNIYLFCKEAINNAVKYSHGSLLEFTVKETDIYLDFCVVDNGKGFNMLAVLKGNGLENMQKRADEIGAKFIFKSEENKGTLISLQYKITQ